MLRESEDGGLGAVDGAFLDDRDPHASGALHLRLVPNDSEPPDSEPPDSEPPADPCVVEADAATGSELRFEDLYERYFDDVYRSLALLGVPMATREDAAQDVFVVVHRRLADFEGRSTPRTWILGIARRVASHHRRSGFREWRRRDAWSREVRTRHTSLEGVIENQEAAEILEAFLETLPQEQREAFVLGAVQGLGRTEIGTALGINPNTAYSRLRLARARFKERVLDSEAQAELLTSWRKQQRNDALRARVWSLLPMALTGGTQGGLVFGKLHVSLKSLALGFALTLPFAIGAAELSVPDDPGVRAGAQAIVPVAVPDREERQLSGNRRPIPAAAPVPEPIDWHPHVEPTVDTVAAPVAPRPSPNRAPPTAGPSAQLGEIDLELTMLRTAQDAQKRGDAAATRAALDAHARAFPRGRLALERDLMLTTLRCEGGSAEEAKRALNDFTTRYPNAPQARGLQRRCAKPSSP